MEIYIILKDNIIPAEFLNDKGHNQSSWFCVQTHPKHEHIAARCLPKASGIEVFNPQMRIPRATRRGRVWFTESAFPGYIFVQFNLQAHLDTVRFSSGVTKVVQFNKTYPRIPDFRVVELRAIFGASNLLVLNPQISVGDTVKTISGAFHDLVAVVQSVQPAKQRIRALLEFLGRM